MSRIGIRKRTHTIALSGLVVLFVASFVYASETPFIVYHEPQGGASKATWPEKDLAERFAQYWKAFQRGERDFCYNAEAPHFRYLHSLGRYGAYWSVVTKLRLESVEVFSIEQRTPDFVEVPMWLIKKDDNGEIVRVGMKDRWVKVSGQWYHLLRDPIAFPGS